MPAVDDALLHGSTPFEVIDGRLVYVPPCEEPHGQLHAQLAALLRAFVVASHRVAIDMKTRIDVLNEVAPDASVYPDARDPRTGGRQLEELAFEVVSTERIEHAETKARMLHRRGVRRVFALDLDKQRVLEWAAKKGAWKALPTTGAISDTVLVKPLPVEALLDAATTDNAMAGALLAKNNPVLVSALERASSEGRAEGRAEGEAAGLRAAIESACELLEIELTVARQKRLSSLDVAGLAGLLSALKRERRWPGRP